MNDADLTEAGIAGKPPAENLRRRAGFVDEGAYQVDLITALFSVLLILLIVSVPQITQSVSNPGLMDYRTKDLPVRPFQLETFAALYPFRRVWLLKDGEIGEIDFDAIARRYASQEATDFETTIEGADLRINTMPRDLDGFRLELLPFQKGLPTWVVRKIHVADDVATVSAEMLAVPASMLMFVWADQAATASRYAAVLADGGKPHKFIHLEPNYSRVELSRSAGIFDTELVLRPY